MLVKRLRLESLRNGRRGRDRTRSANDGHRNGRALERGFGDVADEQPTDHVTAATADHDRVVVVGTGDDRPLGATDRDDDIDLGVVLGS